MGPLVVVAGARPNFMKVAPLLRAAEGRVATLLVHTGQHYDFAMSGVFFEQLGIRAPDVHLEVGSGGHGVQTGRIMVAFEQYVTGLAEAPAAIVVVGDVNSTMACALVGVKLGIPVVHVEAGLRSFDRTMPEEINRIVTDSIADLLLVSEPAGLVNLACEGIAPERVQYVGNVMIDTLVHQLAAARALRMPERMDLGGEYALVTLHRPSNVDAHGRLAELVGFVERLAREMPVVFPVHPRTDAKLREHQLRGALEANPAIRLVAPLGYREFIGLLDRAAVIVTDSGGVQEESTYLGRPCITLRSTTERPVTASAGTNTLAGEDLSLAWEAIVATRSGVSRPQVPIEGWDGQAAPRVLDAVLERWTITNRG